MIKKMDNLYKSKTASFEFITTSFVTWKDIASTFEVDQEWDLLDKEAAPPFDVIETAFRETLKLLKDQNLDEEILIELENKTIDNILEHWSADTIIPLHIDIEALINEFNELSLAGPKNKNLFPTEPLPGIAIEFFIQTTGINFTIFPPFMIPYTELYYEEYSELPEWNLEDITGLDIIEILFILYLKKHGTLEIDLSDWDSQRTYVEI